MAKPVLLGSFVLLCIGAALGAEPAASLVEAEAHPAIVYPYGARGQVWDR